MKTFLLLLCSLCLASAAFAQAPAAQADTQQFTPDELDQLLGPIALYPDPLISLILPASTVPSDIVLADRYVSQNGDPAQIPDEPWDDSVKALTHYPDLLKWLDQNLDWTTQVGTAYLAQPQDVMDSIQQLRAKARADGTLLNTDQQQVVMDDGDIAIQPTDPDTVYVPQYDPDAVYDDNYNLDDGPMITFDGGWPVGPWLYFWPDWRHRGIFTGDWRRWHFYRGGAGFIGDPNARPWRASPGRASVLYRSQFSRGARAAVITPQALPNMRIMHAKHPPTPGAHGAIVSPPQRDFTGRGNGVSSPGPVVARPVVVEPPVQNVYGGYGRGSDARAASERGQLSRQSYGAPAQQSAPVYRSSAPVFQSYGGGAGASGARGASSRYGH